MEDLFVSYKFLGDLLDNVGVVDASSMVLECAFDPHTGLLVESQVVVTSTDNQNMRVTNITSQQ